MGKTKKSTTVSIDTKILFLELSIVELINKSIDNNNISETSLYIAFNLKKIKLYPFLLSTANGNISRKLIFNNVFTDFKADISGIIEKDVENYLLSINDFSFFDKVSINEDDAFFIPNWEKIKNFQLIEQKELELKNILNFSSDTPFKNLVDLKNNAIVNILKNHPNFIQYEMNDLISISHNHSSWEQMNMLKIGTNFDGNDIDVLKELFLNEDSPLKPLEAI